MLWILGHVPALLRVRLRGHVPAARGWWFCELSGPVVDGVGVLVFPSEDVVHEVGWFERACGKRPAEAFGSGELGCSAAVGRLRPKLDETSDGAGPAAQAADAGPGFGLGTGGLGEQLGPIGDPIDEHAGFDIA